VFLQKVGADREADLRQQLLRGQEAAKQVQIELCCLFLSLFAYCFCKARAIGCPAPWPASEVRRGERATAESTLPPPLIYRSLRCSPQAATQLSATHAAMQPLLASRVGPPAAASPSHSTASSLSVSSLVPTTSPSSAAPASASLLGSSPLPLPSTSAATAAADASLNQSLSFLNLPASSASVSQAFFAPESAHPSLYGPATTSSPATATLSLRPPAAVKP
jgi:hypothetical protein